MARRPRIIIPGVPHHVTQRGNRRQQTFFQTSDYTRYLSLLAQACDTYKVAVWAYCLMPNHVHIIAVPPSAEALIKAISTTHEQYTRSLNFRMGWRGCLWQGRFFSNAMQPEYAANAVRYVELNPVRSGLVNDPFDYPWSSASDHLNANHRSFVDVYAMLEQFPDWRGFLSNRNDETLGADLSLHVRTGRPLGSQSFLSEYEKKLGIRLTPKKPGPKPKPREN